MFSELDKSLKAQHKRKTLNEIREYFQTNKTIELVENITSKFQNEQENILSAILSNLNQTCTELIESTMRITTLENEIKKLKQETNNIKQNLINNDKKHINISKSLYSNQIDGKNLTEQNYYQQRQLDNNSNTTNSIKVQNNTISPNTLIDEITPTNNHEIKPVINQTGKLINDDTRRHQTIVKAQIHNGKSQNFNVCLNNIQNLNKENISSSETTNEESNFDDTNLDLSTDNSSHNAENADFEVKQNDNIENRDIDSIGLNTLQNNDVRENYIQEVEISEETIVFNKNIQEELLEVNIEENTQQNDDLLRDNNIQGIEINEENSIINKNISEELLKVENFEEFLKNKSDDLHNYLLKTNNCVLI